MKSVIKMSVNKLDSHQCGIVRQIIAPDNEMDRLMAMGVCTGGVVELVKRGDPLILKVYGTRIGVSSRLANRIMVEPCLPESCLSK